MHGPSGRRARTGSMSALAFCLYGGLLFRNSVAALRCLLPTISLRVGTIGLSRLFPASPVCGSVIVQPPFGNEIALLRFSVSTVKSDGFQRFFVYSFFVSRNFFYFCAFIGISEIPFRVTEKKQTNYNKLIYTQCKVKA